MGILDWVSKILGRKLLFSDFAESHLRFARSCQSIETA